MREANKKSPGPAAKRGLWAGVVLVLGFLAGCASERGPNPQLPRIGLLSQFTSHNLCTLGISPEIKLYDVPSGVATYRVQMTLISALFAPPWQADVAANGTTIPEGALAGYEGPCPPERQTFSYRFEVMALGNDGQPVAYGWNFASTAWLTRITDIERQRLERGQPATSQLPASPSRPFWRPWSDQPAFFNN
jgi:hypothetical protein